MTLISYYWWKSASRTSEPKANVVLEAMETDFTSRINDLQAEIDRLESDVTGKTATTKMAMFALAIPFIIALVLWFFSPSIVMKTSKADGSRKFDKVRLCIWTILISFVIWGVMGAYLYFTL